MKNKAEIPAFLAEYIECCKSEGRTMFQSINGLQDVKQGHDRTHSYTYLRWLYTGNNDYSRKRQELFVKAWTHGYTIDDKYYYVKMGNKFISFNTEGGIQEDSYLAEPHLMMHVSELDSLPFNIEEAMESGIIKLIRVNR